VRPIELSIVSFLLCLERAELVGRNGAAEDLREDVLVLQAIDRLEKRVVERDAALAGKRAPSIEMETQVVDERAVQIEDCGARTIQDGDRRP
jgi:hypothetical protein